MIDLSECPNLIEDWPQGSGFEPCEDCGHARNKHPLEEYATTCASTGCELPLSSVHDPCCEDASTSNDLKKIQLAKGSRIESKDGGDSQKKRKSYWTEEEDNKLLSLVSHYGEYGYWVSISVKMQSRTGKQCRERYLNHLNPDIKHTPWTKEEDQQLMSLFALHKNRWCKYLHHLPGRSDNAIKQRWRLINRAKARCARGAKSCPSGVTALTDQSISNDDQLKEFFDTHEWPSCLHQVVNRFHGYNDSDGSSDSATSTHPDYAHGHLAVSQLYRGLIDVAIQFERDDMLMYPAAVEVKEEKFPNNPLA